MSDAGSPAAASNGAAHPRTAPGTSCSRRRSKIAHAACFGKSPWDDPLGGESCCGAFRRPFYGPPASALVVPAADIYRGCRMWTRCSSVAVENLPAVHPLLAHRVTSMRCGILLVLADFVAKVENRTTLKISRKLIFGPLTAASLFNATTEVRDRFWIKR
jgi:hypothetical protein